MLKYQLRVWVAPIANSICELGGGELVVKVAVKTQKTCMPGPVAITTLMSLVIQP